MGGIHGRRLRQWGVLHRQLIEVRTLRLYRFSVSTTPRLSTYGVTAEPNENQTTIILDTGTSYGESISKKTH